MPSPHLDEVAAELVGLGERIERQQERIWAELARQAQAAPPRPLVNVVICPGPLERPKRPRGWTVAR